MSTNENNTGEDKRATDKIHGTNLGETKDFNDLTFNKDKDSYELDVKGKDKDYDHPLPYETTAADGGDDNSDYDEANPYIGDEYANKKDKADADLDDLGMHVDDGEIVELDAEDEFLSRTPEDERTDLDEEGYPINDSPKA
ncbi:hypothetical protein [Pedobacter sp. L105]|uniref:hypothetical protein n=1 Tax=Pedobacter sp. L105 TaxID=1641871 RepID=UPI00131C14EB|nr:hypothetical protein [Pedobacter sp. L105]